MKYYFPTSTLNFDNILSSQMLAPSSVYHPDTLWWNRFETIRGDQEEALVLYSKCPAWEISSSERDHYPMVVEIDSGMLPEEKTLAGCPLDTVDSGLEALFLFKPLFFSRLDFLHGRVRFLFRSEQEMLLIRRKTEVGVAECKVIEPLLLEKSDTFQVIDAGLPRFSLDQVLQTVAVSLKAHGTGRQPLLIDSLLERERMRGAELGFRLGRYVKSLRSGSFLDGFRFGGPLTFPEWCMEVMPDSFRKILTRQIKRGASPWNPNRQAVFEFCRTLWFDVFAKSGAVPGSSLHLSMQNIARHWSHADFSYDPGEEKNPFMQAFSVFLECGNRASNYVPFLKDRKILLPEFLLALYGATVGYTSFSRGLLENVSYLPDPVRDPGPRVNPEEPVESEEREEDGKSRPDTGAKTARGKKTDKKRRGQGGSAKSSRNSGIQPNRATPNPVSPKKVSPSVLVFDPDLPDAIRAEFPDPKEGEVLAKIMEQFAEKYQPGGYYGKDPEKYSQRNDKLVSHFMRCTKSQSTRYLNFEWAGYGDLEARFENFLKSRYGV